MKNYMILQIIGVVILSIAFYMIVETSQTNRAQDLKRLQRIEDELMLLSHSVDKDDNLCRFYKGQYDENLELYKETARKLEACQIRLAECREK